MTLKNYLSQLLIFSFCLVLVTLPSLAQSDITETSTFAGTVYSYELSFDYPSGWQTPTTHTFANILPKDFAIERITSRLQPIEGAEIYEWTAYLSEDEGEFGLMLLGNLAVYWVTELIELEVLSDIDLDNLPEQFRGFSKLSRRDSIEMIFDLAGTDFGTDTNAIRIISATEASYVKPSYQYDSELDAIIDITTDEQWIAQFIGFEGAFTNADGEMIMPGYSYVNSMVYQNYIQLIYQSNTEYSADDFDAEMFEGIVIRVGLEPIMQPDTGFEREGANALLDNYINSLAPYYDWGGIEERYVYPHTLQLNYTSNAVFGTVAQQCRVVLVNSDIDDTYASFSMCAIRDDFQNYEAIFEEVIRTTSVGGHSLFR